MRRWAVLLVVMVALAGCSTERVGPTRPPSPSTASGPVDLRQPLELARVVPAGGPTGTAATVAADPDGEQLALEQPFLTITRLEDAAVQRAEYDNSWTIVVRMTEPDARTFGEWTSDHVGERAAIVVNGRVVSAPEIQAAITTGDVVIAGRFTERAAKDLLAQLTG